MSNFASISSYLNSEEYSLQLKNKLEDSQICFKHWKTRESLANDVVLLKLCAATSLESLKVNHDRICEKWLKRGNRDAVKYLTIAYVTLVGFLGEIKGRIAHVMETTKEVATVKTPTNKDRVEYVEVLPTSLERHKASYIHDHSEGTDTIVSNEYGYPLEVIDLVRRSVLSMLKSDVTLKTRYISNSKVLVSVKAPVDLWDKCWMDAAQNIGYKLLEDCIDNNPRAIYDDGVWYLVANGKPLKKLYRPLKVEKMIDIVKRGYAVVELDDTYFIEDSRLKA